MKQLKMKKLTTGLLNAFAIAASLLGSLALAGEQAPAATPAATTAAAAPAAPTGPLPEEVRAQNLDQLLELIRSSRLVESKANQEREARFQRDQGQRQQLLSQAQGERSQEEQRSARLDALFQENERAIAVLQEQLDARLGSLKELFGVLQQVSGDTRGLFDASIVSAQLPDREQWLLDFAKKMGDTTELATIEEIEKLWGNIQEEINQSGKIARFKAQVQLANGEKQEQDVIRIGSFNLIGQNGYLNYENDQVIELSRQPQGRALGSAEDLYDTAAGSGEVVGFAVDPTRGSLVLASGDSATFGERVGSLIPTGGDCGIWIPFCDGDGAEVGSVIIIIGIIGILLAVWRFIDLMMVSGRVKRQLQSDTPANDNPLGRVLQVYHDNKEVDVETLELKLSEAILGEAPKVNRFIQIIQVISVVAPLLGLLGTVVGMIQTFEAITLFGTGDPKTMAEGISVALVTTVEGLVVAIPTVLLHSIVNNQAKGIIHVLEEQSAGMIAEQAERSGRALG